MWASEQLLYMLARCLYRTEVAHTGAMKKALADRDEYNRYRRGRVDRVLDAAARYGVAIAGRVVLDLGCTDGAMTVGYRERGARQVVGVDLDAAAVQRAQVQHQGEGVSFRVCGTTTLPLPDDFFDVIICYDVFEHVAHPAEVLRECRRVLKPGGQMLIGTWGWYHPSAPHLWSTMPVPWAHVVFSEQTILRTCRRVYHAPWYVPTMHDFDEAGRKKDKYTEDEIPRDYLNKLFIKDFERLFAASGMEFEIHPQPFGSRLARWTKVFLYTPWVREFITSYLWVVLRKLPSRNGNRVGTGDPPSPS